MLWVAGDCFQSKTPLWVCLSVYSSSSNLQGLVKTIFLLFHQAYLEVSTKKALSGTIRSHISPNHFMDSLYMISAMIMIANSNGRGCIEEI